MRLRTAAGLLSGAMAMTAAAQAPMQVEVEGAVRHPGRYAPPPGERLATLALSAMPTSQAYPLGAALLREEALVRQTRLKAGLLHGLAQLQQRTDTPLQVVSAAARMQHWLQSAPVTGRVRVQLSPRRTEIDPQANLPLRDGDRLRYPARPTGIEVLGAVREACTLAHAPLRDARDYLADCPPAGADADWLYAIQPDGAVQRLGVAAWNRSPPQALAPGARLYVPLPERELREVDPAFNGEFADFVATQLLPLAEAP